MVVLFSEDEDERLLKKGPDLFKELLRVYPVAEPEDYFKAGQWRDEMMKTDLQLVEAHRLEAGAPDPPALDEVKVPELPTATAPPVGGVRPPLTGLSALMGARATVAGGAVVAAGSPLVAPGSGVAELRLLALFVAKWKLDATKTKMALAKLPAERRRYVIQNFKATATGDEVDTEMDKYIEECEKTEAWGPLKPEPAAGTAPFANGGALVAQAGVKRPFGAMAAPGLQDPSKRPTGPAGIFAARMQLQQPRPAARPPMAMGMQRPMVGPRPMLGRPPMMQGGMGVRPGFMPGGQPRVVAPAVRGQVVAPALRGVQPGAQGGNHGAVMRGLMQKF